MPLGQYQIPFVNIFAKVDHIKQLCFRHHNLLFQYRIRELGDGNGLLNDVPENVDKLPKKYRFVQNVFNLMKISSRNCLLLRNPNDMVLWDEKHDLPKSASPAEIEAVVVAKMQNLSEKYFKRFDGYETDDLGLTSEKKFEAFLRHYYNLKQCKKFLFGDTKLTRRAKNTGNLRNDKSKSILHSADKRWKNVLSRNSSSKNLSVVQTTNPSMKSSTVKNLQNGGGLKTEEKRCGSRSKRRERSLTQEKMPRDSFTSSNRHQKGRNMLGSRKNQKNSVSVLSQKNNFFERSVIPKMDARQMNDSRDQISGHKLSLTGFRGQEGPQNQAYLDRSLSKNLARAPKNPRQRPRKTPAGGNSVLDRGWNRSQKSKTPLKPRHKKHSSSQISLTEIVQKLNKDTIPPPPGSTHSSKTPQTLRFHPAQKHSKLLQKISLVNKKSNLSMVSNKVASGLTSINRDKENSYQKYIKIKKSEKVKNPQKRHQKLRERQLSQSRHPSRGRIATERKPDPPKKMKFNFKQLDEISRNMGNSNLGKQFLSRAATDRLPMESSFRGSVPRRQKKSPEANILDREPLKQVKYPKRFGSIEKKPRSNSLLSRTFHKEFKRQMTKNQNQITPSQATPVGEDVHKFQRSFYHQRVKQFNSSQMDGQSLHNTSYGKFTITPQMKDEQTARRDYQMAPSRRNNPTNRHNGQNSRTRLNEQKANPSPVYRVRGQAKPHPHPKTRYQIPPQRAYMDIGQNPHNSSIFRTNSRNHSSSRQAAPRAFPASRDFSRNRNGSLDRSLTKFGSLTFNNNSYARLL